MPKRSSEWLKEILRSIEPPISIDKICAAFTRENVWPAELLSPEICMERAQKAYARQILENFKGDEKAAVAEFVSVRDERKVYVWKPADELTEEDLKQKIEYCEKLILHYRRQLREFKRRKEMLLAGQTILPFDQEK